MSNKTLIMIVVGSLTLIASCQNNESKTPHIVKENKFVDVDTHKLNVVLSDIKSEYTIILESGGGMDSEVYQGIQDSLAILTRTRVMSYDRSGFGKSELGPDNFNAIDEVNTLKKCLESQGFNNKYILVGHSYGGYLIQLFTALYPELVSGLVLVDPMNIKFIDRFGLDNLNAITPYFETPKNNRERAGNRMVDHFPESFDILRDKALPNHIPVILLTAGNFPIEKELWHKCHSEMVMNSKNHQQIILDGIGHDIMTENPKLVQNTLIDLIKSINVK